MSFEFKPKELILLTGAGFTHNFGTPLAQEMWAWIFNNKGLQSHERIRETLLQQFNYEAVIHGIRKGNYELAEKTAIESSLIDAYEALDEIIRGYNFRETSPNAINLYKVRKLLSEFSPDRSEREKGFIFTLNQDLFLERHFCDPKPGKSLPQFLGINNSEPWFKGDPSKYVVGEKTQVKLPNQEEIEGLVPNQISNGRFFYVKLHGSQNWFDSKESSNQMVIGADKLSQINEQPLLKYYYEIFSYVLSFGAKHLLIIGYGFADPHINEAIQLGIEKGLKIFIISPEKPEYLRARIIAQTAGDKIWNAINGYFPFSLREIFPPDQSESIQWKMIKNSFFAL